MNRILPRPSSINPRALLLVLPIFLAACAKNGDHPAVTAVEPVTPGESQKIRQMIVTGEGPNPGEAPQAGAGCSDFVAQLSGFTAGTLDVPEDWDHPDSSPKIKLFYYWRKGTGEAERRPPVVFYNGGPASDSHGSAKLLAPLEFTANSSLVFVDQRGTGCSSNFPTGTDEAAALRLMNWGSRAIVLDSEALRKHLFGNRKWRAYGQSYGGFIVHRYLEVAPEGLDRAVAHGSSVMQDPISWLTERVRSQKRVAENYFAQNPGDRAVLAMARAAVPADQCWQTSTDKVCGPSVLDSLTILLGFRSSWPTLHRWIQKLQAADGTLDRPTLDGVVRNFVFGVYGEGGLAGNVISKMEIAPGQDDHTGCISTLERMRQAGDNPDAFAINECRLLRDYQSPFYEQMRTITSRPIDVGRIQQNLLRGPVTFHLFSGQQDVFVPVSTFDEEVARLGAQVHYESFPNSGHEGFYTEPHVIDAVTKP